jgi:hypothetical protein
MSNSNADSNVHSKRTSARRSHWATASLLMAIGALSTLAYSRGGGSDYSMVWHTIDGGGGVASAEATSLAGTFGQGDASAPMIGGEYELLGGFWHATVGDGCLGDLDGDNAVAAPDLAVVLGSWGTNFAPADLDSNGIVEASDIAILLGAWGPCP